MTVQYYSQILDLNPTEETLKQIAKETSGKLFSLFYNFTYEKYSDLYNAIYGKIKCKDRTFLYNFLKDNVNVCLECGNYCMKPKIFCSQKCSRHSNLVKEKRQATNLKRYGVLNANNVEKYKKTCLLKYGVENPQRLDSIKEKTKQTNILRYGCHHSQTKEFTEKVKKTSLERYGVENYAKTQECTEKKRKTKLERYGDSNYCNIAKLKQTMLERYGVENISQNEENKLKVKAAFAKKFKINEFYTIKYQDKIDYVNSIDNLAYEERLKTNYNINFIQQHFIKNNIFDIISFMLYFGMTKNTAYKRFNALNLDIKTELCFTSFECKKLFNSINTNNKILNDRNIISPFELDIVLPDVKLAIEYDGIYWHSSLHKEPKYHLNKTIKCAKKGYQLFHIFETDDIKIWKSLINEKLNLNKFIDENECIISVVSEIDSRNFLNENHINGYTESDFNVGLYFNKNLVQIMSFKNNELLRMCNLKGYSISYKKLFNYCITKYDNIISKCDLRFSNGKELENLGFKYLKTIEPRCLNIRNFEIYDCGLKVFKFSS